MDPWNGWLSWLSWSSWSSWPSLTPAPLLGLLPLGLDDGDHRSPCLSKALSSPCSGLLRLCSCGPLCLSGRLGISYAWLPSWAMACSEHNAKLMPSRDTQMSSSTCITRCCSSTQFPSRHGESLVCFEFSDQSRVYALITARLLQCRHLHHIGR